MKKKIFTLLCLCTLCIGSAWGATYSLEKVTSVSTGNMYVFEQGGHVMINTVSSNALQTTNTYSKSYLTGAEKYVWIIGEKTSGSISGYTLKNAYDSKYINNNSSTNISLSETAASIWDISFDEKGVALISNKSNSDRFLGYTTETSYVYKAYATNNLSSYSHAITVYQLVEESSKTLTSIEVSGTPTKSTYDDGEAFDPTGLTVTGTYSDESSKTITDGIEWTVTPETLSLGTTSVSVVAKIGEVSSLPYTVNGLTVTEHVVIPGTYDIVPNTSFFNCEAQTTGKHDEVSGEQNDITILHSGGSNFYVNNTQTRMYTGNTLKFSVPSGYVMTAITFTAEGSNWQSGKPTVDNGSMTDSKNWAGENQEVTITFGGTCRITKISVTYEAKKTLQSIAITTAPKAVYNAKETFDPTGMVITATYDDESTKDITYDANDDKWSFDPDLTTLLKGTDNKVTITYGGKTADQAITVNRLSAGLNVASTTKDVVVDDTPDISEWYSVEADYDGTITVSSDNTDVFEADATTGAAYAAGIATLTITAPQTDYYAGDSKTIEVTVSSEAKHYTVTWMNKGTEYTEGAPTTEVIAGQKVVTMPTTPTAVEGTAFMGWTANETISDGQAPLDLFKTVEDAPTVDADVIYRAVYAQEQEGDPIVGFALSNKAPADKENVLIAGLKDSKYYALKVVGTTVSAIELTLNNGLVSNTNVEDYTWTATELTGTTTGIMFKIGSGDPLHINSSAIKTANGTANGTFDFTADATNGGFQMKSNQNDRWLKFTGSFTYSTTAVGGIYFFKETELPGEVTYVNYSLNNVEPIKDITVTPSVEEAETYWDAFTVTLTCATTGAEIRYTLDGSDPKESETVYSSAINISGSNETITLRAIATDGNGNWSKEVTKEYKFGAIFANLEDLVNAGLTSGTTVKVSFENVAITDIYVTSKGYRNGIYLNVKGKNGKDVEIFYQNVPEAWIVGGRVSGTMVCPWTYYKDGDVWELAPNKDSWAWDNLTYVAPASANVTISAAKYATLGLPYAVTIPEGVSAYTATVEDNTVTLSKINKSEGGSNVIPANCGVIIYAEAGNYTFNPTADVKLAVDNKLVAVIGKTYVCAGDYGKDYYLGLQDNKAVFKKLALDGTIPAGKAYLKLDAEADAKLEVTFNDEPTGIKTIDNGQLTIDNSKAYNLNGVRVNQAYKGIIIVNGKKYMNK